MAQFKRRADAFSLPRRVSIVVVIVSAAFLFLFRGADRLKGRHGLPVRRVDFLFAGRRASFFSLSLPLVHIVYPTRRQRWKKRNGGQHSRARPLAAIPKNCRGSRVPPFFPRVHALGLRWIGEKFFCPCCTHDIAPPRCSLHFFTFAFLSGSLDNTSSPFLRMYAKETEKKRSTRRLQFTTRILVFPSHAWRHRLPTTPLHFFL